MCFWKKPCERFNTQNILCLIYIVYLLNHLNHKYIFLLQVNIELRLQSTDKVG